MDKLLASYYTIDLASLYVSQCSLSVQCTFYSASANNWGNFGLR